MEKRLLAAMGMVGHSLAMLVLAFTTSNWWVPVFAVLQGVAWGVRGPLMSAIRADYFGRRAFGTIMGFSTPIVMLGTIFGPMLVAVVADRTGTEQQGFVILSDPDRAGDVLLPAGAQACSTEAPFRDHAGGMRHPVRAVGSVGLLLGVPAAP